MSPFLRLMYEDAQIRAEMQRERQEREMQKNPIDNTPKRTSLSSEIDEEQERKNKMMYRNSDIYFDF